MTSWQPISAITDALDDLEAAPHHHQESAWVAGSGKAELYIRDRLGAALAARHRDLIVAREWQKHDLAVLDAAGEPLAVVEGKALYDFDLLAPGLRSRYKRALLADRRKLLARRTASPLLTLLMTSIRGEVPASLARVVKYSADSNRCYRKHGHAVTELAVAAARRLVEEIGIIEHERRLTTGQAFGLETQLWIWVARVHRRRS